MHGLAPVLLAFLSGLLSASVLAGPIPRQVPSNPQKHNNRHSDFEPSETDPTSSYREGVPTGLEKRANVGSQRLSGSVDDIVLASRRMSDVNVNVRGPAALYDYTPAGLADRFSASAPPPEYHAPPPHGYWVRPSAPPFDGAPSAPAFDFYYSTPPAAANELHYPSNMDPTSPGAPDAGLRPGKGTKGLNTPSSLDQGRAGPISDVRDGGDGSRLGLLALAYVRSEDGKDENKKQHVG